MKEIQPDIRNFSETADWQYKAESQKLYSVGEHMMGRFFNGLVYLDGRKMPNPVFAFDDLRNHRVLAQYHLVPDEYGIMYRITMNTAQYENGVWRFGEVAKYETVLHEMVHTWQQHGRGNHPYTGGRETHNAEFVKKCNELGLHPKKGPGYHVAPPDREGPFGILMRDLNIAWDVPEMLGEGKKDWFIDWDAKKRGERRGTSTLHKWVCSGCGLSARIGIKDDPQLLHIPCGTVFVSAEGANVSQPIYTSGKRPTEGLDLVTEAYRTKICIADKTKNMGDEERAVRLNRMAQERLDRRLEELALNS